MSLIIGGTLFISTVVASMSTYASNLNPDPKGPPIKMIKVTPRYFLRDLIFFNLSSIYLLITMLFLQKITLWSALGMPILYLIYVVIVVIQNRQSSNENKEQIDEKESLIKPSLNQEEEEEDLDKEDEEIEEEEESKGKKSR